MNQLKADYQVQELAQALESPVPSGFYAHQHKPKVCAHGRTGSDRADQADLCSQSCTYGSPRSTVLAAKGRSCGKNRWPGSMREHHLVARQKRRFVPRTTRSDHDQAVAPIGWGKCLLQYGPTSLGGRHHYLPSEEGGFIWPSFWTLAPAKSWAGLWAFLGNFLGDRSPGTSPRSCRPPPGLLHHQIGEFNMPVAPTGRYWKISNRSQHEPVGQSLRQCFC